jgi:predicted RNA-binding Zn-ribbon protein involved in translation (DUF1610 family)
VDITSVTAAVTGIRFIKDSLEVVRGYKIDIQSQERINEALKQAGTVYDTLFDLREELFRLQSENQELQGQIKKHNDLQSRKEKYKFDKTSGGAFVWVCMEEPIHYACPKCFDSSIQILQDKRNLLGKFECPSCLYAYPIMPESDLDISPMQIPKF